MFNDDVTAQCPECRSGDVYYHSDRIGCHACKTEEPFGFDFQKSDPVLEGVNRAHALSVLQRWQFAG